MNRYLITAVVAFSVVAVAVGFALRGSTSNASASPAPKLEDRRHFGLVKSVETTPGTIVFDPAEQLTGEEANRAAAAHGDEVPVPNDVYKVNDDPTVHTLALSSDVEIRLINWDNCCDTVSAEPEAFKASFRGSDNYWGFWVTLEHGVVVKIEEQYHP